MFKYLRKLRDSRKKKREPSSPSPKSPYEYNRSFGNLSTPSYLSPSNISDMFIDEMGVSSKSPSPELEGIQRKLLLSEIRNRSPSIETSEYEPYTDDPVYEKYRKQVLIYKREMNKVLERIRTFYESTNVPFSKVNVYSLYNKYLNPLRIPKYSEILRSHGQSYYDKMRQDTLDFYEEIQPILNTEEMSEVFDEDTYLAHSYTNLYIRYNLNLRYASPYLFSTFLYYLDSKYDSFKEITICPFDYSPMMYINDVIDYSPRAVERYRKYIKDTLSDSDLEMILMTMGVNGHQTMMIIYPKLKEVRVYETYGLLRYTKDPEFFPLVLDHILKSEELSTFKIVHPKETNPVVSFQTIIESYANNWDQSFDPEGYCQILSLFFIDYRLFHHDKHEREVFKAITEDFKRLKIVEPNSLVEFIRDYYVFVHEYEYNDKI